MGLIGGGLIGGFMASAKRLNLFIARSMKA